MMGQSSEESIPLMSTVWSSFYQNFILLPTFDVVDRHQNSRTGMLKAVKAPSLRYENALLDEGVILE